MGVSALRILVVITGIVSAACFGNGLGDLNPVERDAGEAGIRIEVVGCELDETTGNVTSTVEVTSEREYSTVLVDFKLVDAQGTVVASTSTSASNVRPGETYRLEMLLSPAGELGEGFTCEADLNLATEPFG
ncbi:MAG: FxLYD domain-containing protein [Actinomycetota bacterium]